MIFGVLGATVEVADGAGSVAVSGEEVVGLVGAVTRAAGSQPLDSLEVTEIVGRRLSAPAVPLPNCVPVAVGDVNAVLEFA